MFVSNNVQIILFWIACKFLLFTIILQKRKKLPFSLRENLVDNCCRKSKETRLQYSNMTTPDVLFRLMQWHCKGIWKSGWLILKIASKLMKWIWHGKLIFCYLPTDLCLYKEKNYLTLWKRIQWTIVAGKVTRQGFNISTW